MNYVWYASYGSNLNRDRFLCYIKGGSPKGSTRVEPGCRDRSLPKDESVFTIHYPFYFAKEASGWQSKGVGFIGHSYDSKTITLSKKYLITDEQFFDVVKQENGGLDCEFDLHDVIRKGSFVFRKNAWYGKILYLGEDRGYPIFTFTAPWQMSDAEYNQPSKEYLSTIIKGLKTDYSNEEIFAYFKGRPGIEGYYSDEELTDLIRVIEG